MSDGSESENDGDGHEHDDVRRRDNRAPLIEQRQWRELAKRRNHDDERRRRTEKEKEKERK